MAEEGTKNTWCVDHPFSCPSTPQAYNFDTATDKQLACEFHFPICRHDKVSYAPIEHFYMEHTPDVKTPTVLRPRGILYVSKRMHPVGLSILFESDMPSNCIGLHMFGPAKVHFEDVS